MGRTLTRAFIRALSHETVVSKLSVIITKDLRTEIATLRSIIEKKDEKLSMLEKRINHLENEQDTLEQYTRRNSLRVSGLEELDYEDPAQVALCLFNSTMNMQSRDPVSINDIDRVHRVGKRSPGRARQLLVKFATYRARQRVFQSKRRLNPRLRGSGDAPWGVTPAGSADSSATGPRPNTPPRSTESQVVFINEDLTSSRASLLYQARQAKKGNTINDCWTSDGKTK